MSTPIAFFIVFSSILVFFVPFDYAMAGIAGCFFALIALSVIVSVVCAWFKVFDKLAKWLEK